MTIKLGIVVMIAFPVFCRGAGPLDPYLLRPGDLPAPCHSTSGFYPVNEKTDLFYQYKVYQSVLPPALERHAQSFDCAGQKGTIYFFAYATADQAQAAELFAKPVVSRIPPAPLFRDWSKGFVMVSYADPPKELLAALDTKLSGRVLLPIVQPSVAPVPSVFVSSAAIPEPVVVPSSPTVGWTMAATPVSLPVISTPVVAPSALPVISTPVAAPAPLPIVSTGAAPPVPHVPAVPAAPVPAVPVPDLSDDVIKHLMQKVPCHGRDMPDEGKPICDLLRQFRRGETLAAVIAPDQPLMGMTYWVDNDGGLSGPAYEAALGTGRPCEVAFVPLISATGVEEFEAQALVDSRRDRRPWPTNDLTAQIAKHARPVRATAFPTQGLSLVIPMKGERRIFVRQSGRAWILVGVSGSASEEQWQSDATVGVLY